MTATALSRCLQSYRQSVDGQVTSLDLLDVPAAEIAFARTDAFAFFLAVLADQSVRAETAWRLPFRLRERCGHLSAHRFATSDVDEVAQIVRTKPALHRYPRPLAERIVGCSARLVAVYDGDPSNVWRTPVSAKEVIHRLLQFPGIGPKKANLCGLLLAQDRRIEFDDLDGIDIAYELHVRRVLVRTGAVENDTESDVRQWARQEHPTWPGALTTPLWTIGRRWCHAGTPQCPGCPLRLGCVTAAVGVR